jgi:hypothetical protein
MPAARILPCLTLRPANSCNRLPTGALVYYFIGWTRAQISSGPVINLVVTSLRRIFNSSRSEILNSLGPAKRLLLLRRLLLQ